MPENHTAESLVRLQTRTTKTLTSDPAHSANTVQSHYSTLTNQIQACHKAFISNILRK